MKHSSSLAMLAGRISIALVFIIFGLNKLADYSAVTGWMDATGVPGVLLPLVIIFEFFGGIAIIVGWRTRYISLALAGFCILSAGIFHSNFAQQAELANFMKNIAIAGGFLFLFANGPGELSLDSGRAD